MTRDEQIIAEAKKYYSDSINCYNAFLHGVEWADAMWATKGLWHKADEEPLNKDAVILCLSKYTACPISYQCSWLIDSTGSWKNAVKNLSITHWLYVEDIIPADCITNYKTNLLWMVKLKK